MKKFILLTALSISLVACSNNSEISNDNEVNNSEQGGADYEDYFLENITEGKWLSYDGSSPVHDEFSYTDHIPYNPSERYTINNFGYVSYFEGGNFLTTKKITKPYPSELETVENADSVKISFQTEKAQDIELLVK